MVINVISIIIVTMLFYIILTGIDSVEEAISILIVGYAIYRVVKLLP